MHASPPRLLEGTRRVCRELRARARVRAPRRASLAAHASRWLCPPAPTPPSTHPAAAQPRFIQHKTEAFWFYRFLSIVYDSIVNPGHWTEEMREDALEPAKLDDRALKVVDVGGGTGFCTLGIVKSVDAANVTLMDQSPHQLAKARAKPALKGVTIVEVRGVLF